MNQNQNLLNFRRIHLSSSAKRKQPSRSSRNQYKEVDNNVVGINDFSRSKRQVTLLPKTLKQEEYIDLLINPKKLLRVLL